MPRGLEEAPSQYRLEETSGEEDFGAKSRSVAHARLKLDSAGRIVIPAEMRAAMMVKPGDTVTAELVDGEFRIVSMAVAIRRAQALARALLPSDTSLVESLITSRREEALREAEESDAWRASKGLAPLE